MYPIGFSEFTGYLDAQDEYRTLRETLSVRQATEQILESMKDDFEDYDDGPFCWIGLAKAQIRRKELMDIVAENAIGQLDVAILRAADQDLCFRKNAIQKFREELKDEKYRVSTEVIDKIPKPKIKKEYRCPWKKGDVFAYQMRSDEAKAAGLYGKYCLIRKIDEESRDSLDEPRTWPIVYITIWDKADLPQNMSEIQKAGYMQTGIAWKHAFTVNPRKELKIDLFQYRLELKIWGEKQLEKYNFQYLGNYPRLDIPSKEVVMVHASTGIKWLDTGWGVEKVELKQFEKRICELYTKYGVSYPELKAWDSDLFLDGATVATAAVKPLDLPKEELEARIDKWFDSWNKFEADYMKKLKEEADSCKDQGNAGRIKT